jgi:hypothetical protein
VEKYRRRKAGMNNQSFQFTPSFCVTYAKMSVNSCSWESVMTAGALKLNYVNESIVLLPVMSFRNWFVGLTELLTGLCEYWCLLFLRACTTYVSLLTDEKRMQPYLRVLVHVNYAVSSYREAFCLSLTFMYRYSYEYINQSNDGKNPFYPFNRLGRPIEL